MYLKRVGESTEDITLALLIANDLGALQVAADVLLQRQRQVAVGHKLGDPLHLQHKAKLRLSLESMCA